MEFHAVAGRVGDEGLTARAHGPGIAHFNTPVTQLGHRGLEVVDLKGEVLAEIGRRLPLDQMDLLAAGVEPGAAEGKVGAVSPRLEAEDIAVEAECGLDVVDVEGDVMDSQGTHPAIVAQGRR